MLVNAALHTILATWNEERKNIQTNECSECASELIEVADSKRKDLKVSPFTLSHLDAGDSAVETKQTHHHANLFFQSTKKKKGRVEKADRVSVVTKVAATLCNFERCLNFQPTYSQLLQNKQQLCSCSMLTKQHYEAVPFQLSGHCVCGSICIAQSKISQAVDWSNGVNGEDGKPARACNAWSNIEDWGKPLGQLTLPLLKPLGKATGARLMIVFVCLFVLCDFLWLCASSAMAFYSIRLRPLTAMFP